MSRRRVPVSLRVNGTPVSTTVRPNQLLADFLHDDLALRGTRSGCGQGICGCCTVWLDGDPVKACLVLAAQADGAAVTTIEGLTPPAGLHAVQEAFVAAGAVQCGFCIPGMVMTAAAFVRDRPAADDAAIRDALANNLCRCTGYVKIVDAVRMVAAAGGVPVVPTNPSPAATRDSPATIGLALPRLDAPDKVTGRACYSGDREPPGAVFARILRSPHAHARIVAVDATEAAALPGVVAVLTADNAPRVRFTSSPADAAPGARARITDECLFDQTVRHVGQAVAMVAAEDWETAEDALERIAVNYEPLAAVTDPVAALADGAHALHEGRPNNLIARVRVERGAVDAGFAGADVVIERRYRTSRQKHAVLEPQVCTADWNGVVLTVWTPTQSPHQLAVKLAALWGLSRDRVRVIAQHVGGGFGQRLGFVLEPYVTAMAMRLRRPVKCVLDRLEDFTATESRHPMLITVRAGARTDGTLTALQVASVIDAGAYAGPSVEVAHVHANLTMRHHRCPAQFEGEVVYTTTPPCGSFRGVGGPQAAFSVEQCLDELADRIGCDPVEFRRRNCLRLGEHDPWTTLPLASWALDEVLDRGRTAIRWDEYRRRRLRDGAWVRGVGMAVAMHVSGANCISVRRVETSEAEVQVSADGMVEVRCGQSEIGTGVTTTMAQIVATELGLPLDRVRVCFGDSARTPYDSGAHSSRTAFTTGWAVRRAAEDARGHLLRVAAAALEAREEDLELRCGMVGVKGTPARRVALNELVRRAGLDATGVVGRGTAPVTNAPPFGAHFADVSVNLDTGQIRVNRYVAVHDVGRALNRAVVEGQIQGAVAQGMGFALSEEVRIDADGGVLTTGFADYRVPTATDVPPIEVILVECPDPNGPYGAKGVGEVGIVPVAGALANAVADATGVRILHAPMTPPRVVAALTAAEGVGDAWGEKAPWPTIGSR